MNLHWTSIDLLCYNKIYTGMTSIYLMKNGEFIIGLAKGCSNGTNQPDDINWTDFIT